MLSRRDPFREMISLRDAMDRLVDSAFLSRPSQWDTDILSMAMDVSETEEEYLVKASIPGINPDDLDITFEGNTLTIKGEVKEEREEEEARYHLRERRFGRFARSVSLPSDVNPENIQANYESGVLTLHLAKAEEAKPKRISVRSTESSKMIEAETR